MDRVRAELKARLAQSRKVWRSMYGGPRFIPVCDLCGKPYPTDLHENILTRGDSQGNPELKALVLTSAVNLHLLCNFCNTRLAMAVPCARWLTSINIYRYGVAEIEDWIKSLPLINRAQYLNHVGTVVEEMDSIKYEKRWDGVNAVLAEYHITAFPYSYQEVTLWQSRLPLPSKSSRAT